MTPLRDPNPEHRLRVDRTPWSGPAAEMRAVARQILSVCGGGRMLIVGDQSGRLLRQVLSQGVDAHGLTRAPLPVKAARFLAPERLHLADGFALPFQGDDFDSVVALESPDRPDDGGSAEFLNELHRVARRFVFARIDKAHRPECRRENWQAAFFDAGFRQHPLSQWAADYNRLEREHGVVTLVFEKIPAAALQAWPLEKLKAERDLHMDMLREPGRRADAHIARYVLAASLVRPGDVVLDAACGLGYGSAILAAGAPSVRVIGVDNSDYAVNYARENFSPTYPLTEFRVADVNCLDFLEDASVDLIACFETLEHVADGKALLSELRRVMRPAGRIVLSVPNEWTDETGRDPNPHHLSVYDWGTFHRRVARHFLPERAWSQVAGGSMKLTDHPRTLTEVPIADRQTIEAEWWLIAGMKDPVRSANVPYVENNYPDYHRLKRANITAFGRDFDNAWLMRAMISMGMRAENPALLESLARRTVLQSRSGSPDRGAALCVLAYRWLDSPQRETPRVDQLLSSIAEYQQTADDSPHGWRWRISCQYVAARILLALGRRDEARAAFLACASMDCLKFSPLLATKTVDAWWQAGMIAAVDGRYEDARDWWGRGVLETRRVLAGDWTNIWGKPQKPAPFGLPEVAEIADLASRCAYGIHALDHAAIRPGYAWRRATQNKREELAFWRELAARREAWIRQLEEARQWQETQRAELLQQVDEYKKAVEREAKGASGLAEAVAWHAQQLAQHETELERQRKLIEEKDAWARKVEEGKAWLESQVEALTGDVREREERIKTIEQWNLKLAGGNHWLSGELETLQGSYAELQKSHEELRQWSAELESAKKWFEEERDRLATALTERDARVEELVEWNRALDEGLKWLEQQRIGLETTAAERETSIHQLQSWTATLEEGRQWLEGQRSRFETTVMEREAVIEELRGWIASLEEGKSWLEEERARLTGLLEERDRTVRELRGWNATLEEAKTWFDAERERFASGVAEREATINELRQWNGKLEEGRAWHEAQRAELEAALAEKDNTITNVQTWNGELQKAKEWLTGRVEELEKALEDHAAAGETARRDGELVLLKSHEACRELEQSVLQTRLDLEEKTRSMIDRDREIEELRAKLGEFQSEMDAMRGRCEAMQQEQARLRGMSVWEFLRRRKNG